MDCSAESLIQAAACYRCIPQRSLDDVGLYLLCQWANQEETPPTPTSTLLNGLMAYFPIDVNDNGDTSARSLLETRISSKADPANGFVNPAPSAGVGYPDTSISGQIYPCLVTGELSGECLIFPSINLNAGNNQITWAAWASAEGPVLYVTKYGGDYYYQLIDKATVNAGWVDSNEGWSNVSTSTIANYPEIINRIYYRASQLARPTALPLGAGYLDASSSVFLNNAPYLLVQPSFRFVTQDYSWAWVGQMKGATYALVHRSPGIERWKGNIDALPGLTCQVTCSHSTLAAPSSQTLVIGPTGGSNDWFLIVCRYSTAENRMYVDGYDLSNGTLDTTSGNCNPPRIWGSYAMTDALESVMALGGSYHFNVRSSTVVDKFYCWNRKLTDLEVAELYNAGLLWEPEKPL